MGIMLSFDIENRPIISYHKYDAAPPESGNSQIYNARWEMDHWNIVQASNWSYRWEFDMTGSIPNEIFAESISIQLDGLLRQYYSHVLYGTGFWLIDSTSLRPVEQCVISINADQHDYKLILKYNTALDIGASSESHFSYIPE